MASTQKARSGLDLLKEAVLEVLRESQNEGRIHVQVISDRLSIPKVHEDYAHSNTLVKGVLFHLRDSGLVDRVPYEGWRLVN